jgi:excisionase family DNA binding protein
LRSHPPPSRRELTLDVEVRLTEIFVRSFDQEAKDPEVTKRFYSQQEVAQLLGVSPTTVMARIRDGALPAVRVSERIYRIPVPALERFVSTQPARTFEIAFRPVDRVKKLGEAIVTPADDLL